PIMSFVWVASRLLAIIWRNEGTATANRTAAMNNVNISSTIVKPAARGRIAGMNDIGEGAPWKRGSYSRGSASKRQPGSDRRTKAPDQRHRTGFSRRLSQPECFDLP